jgi:uncharacterized protein YjdB
MKKIIMFTAGLLCLGTIMAQNHSLKFSRPSNQNVVLTNGPVLGSTFTIEAFVKPNQDSSNYLIIGNDDNANYTAFKRAPFIMIYKANVPTWGFDNGSSIHYSKLAGVSHNYMWNHLAVTYDGNVLSFYSNGKLIDTIKQTLTLPATAIKYIGGQMRNTTREYFNGMIDEVRVWDVCKSPAQLAAGMTTNSLTGSEANLKMLYTFEGDIIDKTGNSTATLNGAVYDADQYAVVLYPTVSASGTGTKGLLKVAVTTDTVMFNTLYTGTGKHSPNNVFAVWVSDSTSGKPVRTLINFGARHTYELFVLHSAKNFGNYAPDSWTGASNTSHKSYNLTWDGKDMYGTLLDDNTYSLQMDLNDHTTTSPAGAGAGSNFMMYWKKGTNEFTVNPANDSSFKSIQVQWITSVMGVTVSPVKMNLIPTGTGTITPIIAPADAIDQSVTWASSDTTVAKVSAAGVVTAIKVGTTDIICTTVDGAKKDTCAVKVVASAINATGVILNKSTLSLIAGSTGSLISTIIPDSATNSNVTWSTTDSTIATVSNGTVSAVKAGTVKIIVTSEDGGFKDTCDVTILANTLEQLETKAASLSLYPNPASGSINISFVANANGQTEIYVVSAIGVKVAALFVNAAEGLNIVPLSLEDISNGMYFILVRNNGKTEIRSFVVEK